MKEHPIIFSTPMVQAILEGRKTQTRRIIKPQPNENGVTYMPHGPLDWESIYNEIWKPWKWEDENGESFSKFSPYGVNGSKLYVRETWRKYKGEFLFKADEPQAEKIKGWKPSIHMPKEAARLFLQITNIRVERLQDISEQNAIAEGVETLGLYPGYDVSSKGKFEGLWNLINGPESWDANPWVWVIEFKKCDNQVSKNKTFKQALPL